MKRNSGFSLVELMIVIVIIGVLAAVAVPIYNNNVTKAKMSEADATLGSIRTQLRVYYGENGDYPTVASGGYVIGADWNDIKSGEMTGKYFSDSSFTIESTSTAYIITCNKEEALNYDRELENDGTLAGGIDESALAL